MNFFYIAGLTPPDKPIKLEIDLLDDTEYDYYMTALPSRIIVAFKYKLENNKYKYITRFNIIVANENTNVTTGDYPQVKILKKTWSEPNIPPIDREDWNYYIISTYNKEHPVVNNSCDKAFLLSNDTLLSYYHNKEIDLYTKEKIDTLNISKSVFNNTYYSLTLTKEQKEQLLTSGLNNITVSLQSGIVQDTLCTKSDLILDTINLSKPSPTAAPDEIDIMAICPYRHQRYYIGGISEKPIRLDVKLSSTHLAYLLAKSNNEYIIFSKTSPLYDDGDTLSNNKPDKYQIIDALHLKQNSESSDFECKYDVRHLDDVTNNNTNLFSDNVYNSWLKPISHTYTTNYSDIFDNLTNKCHVSLLKNYTDNTLITLKGLSTDDTLSYPVQQDTITVINEQDVTIRAIERCIYSSQWQGIYTDTTSGNNTTDYTSKPVDEIYLKQLININNKDYNFLDLLTGKDTISDTFTSFEYESTESNFIFKDNKCNLPLLTDNVVNKVKYKIYRIYKEKALDTLTNEKPRTHKTLKILALHPLNKITVRSRFNTSSQGYYNIIMQRNKNN